MFCPFSFGHWIFPVFLFTAYFYFFDNFKLSLEICSNKRTILFIVIFHYTPTQLSCKGETYVNVRIRSHSFHVKDNLLRHLISKMLWKVVDGGLLYPHFGHLLPASLFEKLYSEAANKSTETTVAKLWQEESCVILIIMRLKIYQTDKVWKLTYWPYFHLQKKYAEKDI